jgi:hypothetical protein
MQDVKNRVLTHLSGVMFYWLVCVYILCIHYSDMNKAHVYTDTSS